MSTLADIGFVRIPAIESSIDRKYIMRNTSAESLRAYLDVLEELISSCSESDSYLPQEKLSNFIRHDKLRLPRWLPDILSNEERDYIERFNVVQSKIRDRFFGVSYTRNQFANHILSAAEDICCLHADIASIKRLLSEKIKSFKNVLMEIKETEGALIFYLLRQQYAIYITKQTVNFDFNSIDFQVSVIITEPTAPSLQGGITRQVNISTISLKNDSGSFDRINTFDPFDWCTMRLDAIIRKINRTKNDHWERSAILNELQDCRSSVFSLVQENTYHPYLGEDRLMLDDIKKVRKQLSNCVASFERSENGLATPELAWELRQIEVALKLAFKSAVQRLALHGDILFSLGEIKRNNTLYVASGVKGKREEYAFGEENLSAMLASNLKCMYSRENNISVDCEALVGNGRSDIKISQGAMAIAIIECKLVRAEANLKEKVLGAIDQLFARYSENESADSSFGVQLYAIIFAYDKNFRSVSEVILKSIKDYALRNDLTWEPLGEGENHIRLLYTENRGDGFAKKQRIINIIICNLEIDFHSRAKDRKNIKSYSLTRARKQ